MSGRVDVLAVMQEAKDRCECRPGVDRCTPCENMGAARAAAAKLIEAADGALAAFDGEEDSVKEEHADTISKLRAALAGVRP